MENLFFAIVLLTIATGSMPVPSLWSRLEQRIGGGEEVEPGSVAFIVSLQTSGGFHYCSGSIVNQNWIATAAHCTIGDLLADVHVHAGLHNIFDDNSEFEQLLTVETILIHEKYGTSGYGYDISLLELATPAQLGADIWVDSIRLPPKGFVPTGTAIVYGWGVSGADAGKLKALDVQLTDDATCENQYRGQIDETMICGEVGSCQGDSGGPLVYREADGDRTLIGVMSWGRGCGLDGYPAIYGVVQAMRDWIDNNLS